MSQDRQKTYADKSRRPSPNYKVNDLRSPATFVVAIVTNLTNLWVSHSALTPFLNGTETQSPVVPLKKRGRPRKQPLISIGLPERMPKCLLVHPLAETGRCRRM
ncbi:hypothetical protein TNCV_278911 [Trichonephila clavipes]|nr:hypothetical protein TNCV_278911 [Trichonephila clavipes]